MRLELLGKTGHEIKLTIIEKLSQRKSFLSNRDLPLLDWIPAKILDGTCARLNYSRWALDPEDEDYNHLMEGPTATGKITNTEELRTILSSGKMMTFRRGHNHVRDSGMREDFEIALEEAIRKLGGPSWPVGHGYPYWESRGSR